MSLFRRPGPGRLSPAQVSASQRRAMRPSRKSLAAPSATTGRRAAEPMNG